MRRLTDKERLDWLEKHFKTIDGGWTHICIGEFGVDACWEDFPGPGVVGRTIRQAIDAAITDEGVTSLEAARRVRG